MNTQFFFDWDDTLMTTYFLSLHGYTSESDMIEIENGGSNDVNQMDSNIFEEFKLLEQSVIKLLSLALKYSNEVSIITNSKLKWVIYTAKKFLPNVIPLFDRINIISARDEFSNQYPNDPGKWKYMAYQRQLLENYTNVISLSDSSGDIEVFQSVISKGSLAKSIKLIERSTPYQLRNQLDMISDTLYQICIDPNNLRLVV
jgi:hypothetical protein